VANGMPINMTEGMEGTKIKRIFVAAEEGIFLSENDGATWSDFSTGLDNLQIRTLARVSYTNQELFCGSLGYGIYRWDMERLRWFQVSTFANIGSENQQTCSMSINQEPMTIYLGDSKSGVYKSVNGGNSWRESNAGFPNDGVFSFAASPGNPRIIFALTSGNIYRSADAGGYWQSLSTGWPTDQQVVSIDFDSVNPDIIYACSKSTRIGFGGIVMRSPNGGLNWHAITNGLDLDQQFIRIAVDKQDGAILVATQSNNTFVSHDSGANWHTLSQ
jgi:photosystem II stability/assembly factor-like uncharacterized protein